MNCSTPDCTTPAAVLIRSDGLNDDGVMVVVMWSGWERVKGSLYCAPHAGKILAGLPSLRPHRPVRTPAPDDHDTDVFTHG